MRLVNPEIARMNSSVPDARRRHVCSALVTLLATFGLPGIAAAQGYGAPPMPMPPAPMPPAPAPAATGTFAMKPLVSNGSVMGTMNDPNLINPWGVAVAPGGPVWVANNATQTSTAYDGSGNRALVVSLPSLSGTASATGLVYNGTPDFVISAGMASAPALFIFSSASGTLLGWSQGNGASAMITYDDGVGGAVYTGLALASNGTANQLYAADFHNAKVDVFNTQFHKIAAPGGFMDPQLPAGYAPFGIQAVQLAGTTVIVVTYAQHTAAAPDVEVVGPGLGVVNVFDANGTLLKRLVAAGAPQLNAPWGVVLAPATFGSLGNMLLIGNFGDGRISAFDPNSGAFVNTVNDATGQPIANAGLWGLTFGNDALNQPSSTLFFAAGIGGQMAGLYGRIDPQ
jgi:uncharacterized protein (TIGR03118 family)